MTVWRISVSRTSDQRDPRAASVLQELRDFGVHSVRRVATSQLFIVAGDISRETAHRLAGELLADPVTERWEVTGQDEPINAPTSGLAVEVHLKPGVMDPVAASTILAASDMGIRLDSVRTASRYVFDPPPSDAALQLITTKILANSTIEEVVIGARPVTPVPTTTPYRLALRHVPIRDLGQESLQRLSRDAHLFLSLDEMRAIQSHYAQLGREPTDVELETLAQTWSEHCVHKTLKSEIIYRGWPMPAEEAESTPDHPSSNTATVRNDADATPVTIRYGNLLEETIAAATRKLNKPWCISVFKDNAGIIEFDDEYGIAFKVETHNHPSAIEPYGGAATGVGGCIRDIIGCGLGAKPIANTDVFCFASPDWPIEQLPKGILHPRTVFKGVVAGVRDYGNRMGIPTVNGAICFDPRYLGNPLVFCGCVGLIPRKFAFKEPKTGDLIVLVGGRTGRDGIHGATFSSAELTSAHADEFSHAVQIGNAITEKKFLDTLLRARDHADGCLYTAITDCGAGGLSSAVGEMGAELGAVVDLEKVPLKYQGLRYDEVWISEAQERMVLATPPGNVDELLALFNSEDVEATVIGQFTNDKQLVIRYEGATVGELDMDFLHMGIPRTTRTGEWVPDLGRDRRMPEPVKRRTDEATQGSNDEVSNGGNNLSAELKGRLCDLDAASKEWVIRQYDHEVQGGSVIKPLVGPGEGPSDAAVIRPRLDSNRAVAIGCGLCPYLSDIDPYWMAVAAVDEALRNVICVGGEPGRTAILDNFCWGRADEAEQVGGLVRACQGAHDAAVAYGLPFISGKDSLNNEFAIGRDCAIPEALRGWVDESGRISIPGTLLISAISIIEDVTRCVTMDLKAPADGTESEIWLANVPTGNWPRFDLKAAAKIHQAVGDAMKAGLVAAAHDCGEEGYLAGLAEMAFAGHVGCDAWPRDGGDANDGLLPITSGYLLQVGHNSLGGLGELLRSRGVCYHCVARVGRATLRWWRQEPTRSAAASERPSKGLLIDEALAELRETWRSPLNW